MTQIVQSKTMRATELGLSGVWLFEPVVLDDSRGSFGSPFQGAVFREALGFDFNVAQTNRSLSHAGVVRGVHFAEVPPGQAKYIHVDVGAVRDVVVDLRVGSPTFGRHVVVELSAEDCRSVYLPVGMGHAFQTLTDQTVVDYLCSDAYAPDREHRISPLDPDLDLPWNGGPSLALSDKDAAAPTFVDVLDAGLLPDYDTCLSHERALRARARGV